MLQKLRLLAQQLQKSECATKLNSAMKKLDGKLQQEKQFISQVNDRISKNKVHFDYKENLKEYSQMINQIYVKENFAKMKVKLQKETESLKQTINSTVSKEQVQHYNDKFFDQWNKVSNKFTKKNDSKLKDKFNSYNFNFSSSKFQFWNPLNMVTQKIKSIGKSSLKYILLCLFIVGFGYSIPRSIAHYQAHKYKIDRELEYQQQQENRTYRLQNQN